MLFTYFAPESPWYLVRTGQLEKAKKSLVRLSEPSHNVDLDATLAMMVHTDKVEKEEQEGVQLWDCFKGTNLRRTEIACMSFLSQITNGGALCYGATFFYTNLGLEPDVAYNIGVGGQAVALVGTMISWLYIHRFGRRIIWLVGFGSLVLILWTIGFLAIVPGQARPLQWAQAMLCVVWLGSYSMSVGPIVYTIVAEIGSTRLRTQTVVLGRSVYYLGNIVGNGSLQPAMMSPTDWDLKGKTAFFWAGTATLTFIWGFFRLFETKGRTFGEMDYMVSTTISPPCKHVLTLLSSSNMASLPASPRATSSTRPTSSPSTPTASGPSTSPPRSSPDPAPLRFPTRPLHALSYQSTEPGFSGDWRLFLPAYSTVLQIGLCRPPFQTCLDRVRPVNVTRITLVFPHLLVPRPAPLACIQ